MVNILINLTVENGVGLYFEFISTSIDHFLIYLLNFITVLYIALKSRYRIASISLLLVCIFAGYFTFIQIIDALIVLASFTALTWLLTGSKPFTAVSRGKAISLVVIYLTFILIVIEFLSLICWLIFPFFPRLSQEGACRYLVDLETKIFLLTGCLAPLLTVIFLFSWIAKFFLHYNLLKRFCTFFAQDINKLNNIHLKKLFIPPLLIYSVVFSFLVTLYPYSPGLNTDMHPIGVDIPLYENWLKRLENASLFNAFTMLFFEHPGRPLSLFIMYLVKYVSGLSALFVVQFFPTTLGPILVLSVYFFVRKAIGVDSVSSLTAFLSVSSFHVLVGMYAGFLSNWMALIELYLFAGFFFGFLRKKSHLRVIVASFLSTSLLLTHSWTWGMVMGILLIYLLLTLIKRKSRENSPPERRILFAIILINISAGVIRNYALGLPVGDLETLKVARNMVSIDSLTSFWEDVLYTFLHTMYGFFVNPMALLLAVLGSFIVVLNDNPVSRYLTAWLICSSIFFVLTSGWPVKSRILFNIPLPIFESLGLATISSFIQRIFGTNKSALIKNLIILLILLVSLNYAFRCSFAMSQLIYDLF